MLTRLRLRARVSPLGVGCRRGGRRWLMGQRRLDVGLFQHLLHECAVNWLWSAQVRLPVAVTASPAAEATLSTPTT